MPHIIISYRRTDSDAITGRIRDRLAAHFGDDSIFMDVDSIPLGTDFREHIKQALATNDILIAVVGPKWLGQGRGGTSRIMEGTDPVRIEVETAMKSGSVVIPVLVAGANMPDPEELPDGLKDFAYRNAADVDAGRDFNQHMERLIRSMDQILTAKYGKSGESPSKPIIVPPPQQSAPMQSPPVQSPPMQAVPPRPSEPVASPPVVPSAKGPSRARWVVYPVVAVLLAALGGGGVYLFLKPPGTPTKGADETKTQTATQPAVQPGPVAQSGMASVAVDCKLSSPVLFADDFKTVDPAWVMTADIAYHTEGQLALKAQENKITRVTYPSLRFQNPTICAKFKSPTAVSSNDADTDGGLMFWATDTSNFYLASIYPNGSYSVYRMASDTWAQVVPKTRFDGIKTGPGAINEVQVLTKDGTATMFVNGAKVLDFRGQPPKDTSIVGLYGASAKNERNEWRVLNVAVTDPGIPAPSAASAPTPAAGAGCKPTRKAAFEDNFQTPDPGWGVSATGRGSFKDGTLVIKPVTGKAWEQLYPSLLFGSATVCAQVKSPTQMNDINDTANAGVVFWGIDRSNYYTATIFPNGQFGIYRMHAGAWARIVPATKSANVKSGFGAVNDLMVSIKGGVGAFYINGIKTFEFRGQPPKSGGTIGVFAGPEDKAETEWRFQKMVVVEND